MGGGTLALFACILFGIVPYEPFAERYEGKTAKQWFVKWLREPDLSAVVVDAFETNAVPLLTRKPNSYRRACALSTVAPPPVRKLIEISLLGRGESQQLATDWLTLMDARGHKVIPI